MPFKPGESGNPAGKKKGTRSGRMQALGVLDTLLKDAGALEVLRAGLEKKLEQDPIWFFRRIIMPLLPKDATVQFDNKGAIQWVRLSTTFPVEDSMPFTGQKNGSALSAPDAASEKPSA